MDELDLVTLARPAVEEPSEAVTREARQTVMEIASKTGGEIPTSHLQPRLLSWPRWTVPASAALVLALVGLLVFVPSGAPSAAAEVLLAAADQAETLEPPVTTTLPGDGTATDGPGIRYLKTENASRVVVSGDNGENYSAMVHTTRETWAAPDGSGRISEVVLGVEFLSEHDREGWEEVAGDLELSVNDEFGPGFFDYVDYDHLPTDPDALEAVLAEIPQGDTWPYEVRIFWSVQDLLRDRGTPPELRAALYRVAAGIEGIELMGEVTDRAGRTGTGVALEYEGSGLTNREWIIFDPETTELLGEERILLTATPEYRADPPITVWWSVYLDSRQLNQIP